MTTPHREEVRHWLRVAAAVPPRYRLLALLHDVVEDGYAKHDEIVEWFGPTVARQLAHLTRAPHMETYAEYISNLVTGPKASRVVKIADLKDNLTRCDEAHKSCRERWERALARLEAE